MGLFDELLGNSVFCCSQSRSSSNTNARSKSSITAYAGDDTSSEDGFQPLPRRITLSTSPAGAPRQDEVCGIGIVFQDTYEQGLFVSSLVLDGPAYQSRVIQQGDHLLRIDDVDVQKSKAAELGNFNFIVVVPRPF
jgi:C-terminal processing protease CtpA/Prc